ncbi:MAG: site-2 protease family protein [Bdellovibrionia bacterium]
MKAGRIKGWRIGGFRGVDLNIHFSLVFLLLYVLLMAQAQFPHVLRESQMDPSQITQKGFLWGFLFSLGLLFSVVIHEFAHVWMAQRLGVRVHAVTLMMLGGVSEMGQIPESPYAELKISIVGPLMSFFLAALLFLSYQTFASGNLAFFSYWLAQVNLVLGVFNLLPAFPLDGGRALRSFLAARQGMLKATQRSVQVAKAFAWVLGIFGFLGFNLLLVLIAVFLYTAASSEWMMVSSQSMLHALTARQVGIVLDPIDESDPLSTVALRMMELRLRILPVETHTSEPGIIRLDALRQLEPSLWPKLKASSVMEKVGVPLEWDMPIQDRLMDLAFYGALPVSSHDRVEGLVIYNDLLERLDFQSLSQSVHQQERIA